MKYKVRRSEHSRNFFYILEYYADDERTDEVFGPIHKPRLIELRDQINTLLEEDSNHDQKPSRNEIS